MNDFNRSGGMQASDFIDIVRQYFGEIGIKKYLPELIALLPDESLANELNKQLHSQLVRLAVIFKTFQVLE